MTKLSKEQNDLKVKEVQEFVACHAAGLFILNLYVFGLNYSSTEAEMNKDYYSMACRFHLTKILG